VQTRRRAAARAFNGSVFLADAAQAAGDPDDLGGESSFPHGRQELRQVDIRPARHSCNAPARRRKRR
jgi:hypothetical protein